MPTVGILGGGQLARMMAMAAFRLGIRVHVLEQASGSPGGQIAHREIVGDPSHHETLLAFASGCDVVTLESEFVNEEHLAVADAAGHRVLPRPHSVGLIQDKLIQKTTVVAAGVATPAFAPVADPDEARAFGQRQGYPIVIKRRRLGYDGYGNATIPSAAHMEAGWEKISTRAPDSAIYAEAFVPFVKELAVMVARSITGEVKVYPAVETIQHEHICHYVLAPAPIDPFVSTHAQALARTAVEAIDGVGIFGVEFFLCGDGEVLFNEMAPRPHNSGHYTIEGAVTSQYENHIRAIMGWPLGATDLLAPAVAMANILGRGDATGSVANYGAVLADPAAHLHVYGKGDAKKGRKMGHVTVLAPTLDEALRRARETEERVTFQ